MNKVVLLQSSLKNIIRRKSNIINIFLLMLCSTVIIFGFSYVLSIKKLWVDWTRKSIDFRTFVVSYDGMTEEEAIKKLEKIDHVQEVTSSSGYLIDAIAVDFISESIDGQILIRGVTKDGINIVEGENLENYDGDNAIICSKQFNPNSQAYYTDYDRNNTIDMSKYIGKEINLKVSSSDKSEKFKVVGIYDSDYNYSAGDTCYATFKTIRKLNNKYQKDVFQSNESDENGTIFTLPIYMIIDNSDNFVKMQSDLESNGFFATTVTTINTAIGDRIVKIVLILSWILAIISLIIMLITSLKNINNREKEFSICKAIGYSEKHINSMIYSETIIVSFISFIFSILLSKISLTVLRKQFLVNSVEFSRMNLSISIIGILGGFIITILIALISSFISTKKIKEIDILNVLKG